MNRKGVNYDIGTYFAGEVSSRQAFDQAVVRREIEIIARDLHCNAVRISGRDLDRLVFAAECAANEGLEVWFSPALIEAAGDDLLTYLCDGAQAAEVLRQAGAPVVFVAGCELSLFMHGAIDGTTFFERIARLGDRAFWMGGGMGGANAKLNDFLATASAAVRERFAGPVTYASGTWEGIDWAPFDIVSADHYHDARSRSTYAETLRGYRRNGKPVVVTEFGCCTYAGADERGGMGWAIVDWSTVPPQLDGDYVRDEAAQAAHIEKVIGILDAEDVDGAFVFTFVMPEAPTSDTARRDLDLASYGLVKTLPSGEHGQTYPEMPWEPKAAFQALARLYA